MSSYGWARLIGTAIGPGYRLDSLVRAELRTATFTALNLTGHNGSELLVLALRDTADETQLYLRRCLEAKFLRHPNLLTVLDAGVMDFEGQNTVFIVTEAAHTSLFSHEHLHRQTVWRVAADLVAGLAYLHSENLVYCALHPETTWRVNTTWKLGDYHQLRLIGSGRPAETRALIGRMPDMPPEACEGIVTPAWDVWALGVTLRNALQRGLGDGRSARLPTPFDAVVSRCLDPNPATRITIAELAELFSRPFGTPAAPVTPISHPERMISGGLTLRSGGQPAWVGLAIAGAVACTALTLFAIKHDNYPKQTPGLTHQIDGSDSQRAPAPIKASSKASPESAPESQEADRIAYDRPEYRIQHLLNRWVEAVRSRNIDEQVACYAPVVDTFYGKHDVSAGQLRAVKERLFGNIRNVRRFDLSDVRIRQMNPTVATVSFKKSWDFGSLAGSEKGEFVVRSVRGDWKITSERGQKVYWVRRGRSRP